MHNNIMAAGLRDRPPMLTTGRYAQWRSRFLRYIYTRPNGDALRKCILKVETVMNMTPENRAHFESEKEAIHLILTGIGDEIYSTVDASLDVSLVDTESSRTILKEQDTNSRSGNDAHVDDADIRPIYDEELMAKVQTTTEINVFAIGQQHTEQPEFNNEREVDQNVEQCHDTLKSNEAKVKHDIDVIETINIELEHKVAKLVKENETLKRHNKELYDSIKTTRAKNKEHTTSLIANNDKFKAQLQEKGFAIAALKIDVNNDLSKPVTTNYLPKEREFAVAKPHHMIALGSSRNSEPSVMPSARSLSTTNGSKPKPRINNQKSRNWPASNSSCVTTKIVPIAEHSRNSRRWKPTGKIFKTVGPRWVPTRKIFTSSTTKVDREPQNGSNNDITNQYECKQTLDVSADIVMSDSEDSTITYTEVSSTFVDLSDIGSQRIDGLPMMPKDPYAYVVAAFQAPPSPDYVPGPEEPEQEPPSPDFVPKPVYPESMPSEDEVFLAEEQLLPTASSDDDVDDDDDDVEEDEDEEHPASTDSVLPLVTRILAIPTLPLSPLFPLSSPLPHILSPPLPVSPPPLPASPTYPLGYRAAMIRLRVEKPSTSHLLPLSTPPPGIPPLLPIPLPTPSPPMLSSLNNHVEQVFSRPTGGFRVDYGFIGTLDDEIRRDPKRYVGYRITNTGDEMVKDMQGTPAATDMARLSQRMTDFVMTVRQDTDEIYVRLEDA
ncbi:hypothetical protein Tco_1440046 [Tanacetum coccineum]